MVQSLPSFKRGQQVFFCKGPDSKSVRFCGLYGLCQSYSTVLPVALKAAIDHKQMTWLCSNKILLTKRCVAESTSCNPVEEANLFQKVCLVAARALSPPAFLEIATQGKWLPPESHHVFQKEALFPCTFPYPRVAVLLDEVWGWMF